MSDIYTILCYGVLFCSVLFCSGMVWYEHIFSLSGGYQAGGFRPSNLIQKLFLVKRKAPLFSSPIYRTRHKRGFAYPMLAAFRRLQT